MKKNFETKFTGWAFITAALMLLIGWVLLPHHIEEYIQTSDFEAISQNLWYWIWMFRIHIFGWVIMGGAIISLAYITSQKPYGVIMLPGAGITVVGTFTLALATAFYYSYGAWGIGQTAGKSITEIQQFMDGVTMVNHYVTCLVRFGRVFSGAGMLLLGIGLFKWNILDKWLAVFTMLFGMAAMGVIMLIPDNFEIYKPLFYIKVIWLLMVGIMILRKGVNLSK